MHFFVNGVDQGPAATNVPDEVHGVIDLYGQAAQATIVNHSALTSTIATSEDLRFHHLHGRNALVVKQGLTAYRPNAYGEFNDAIVISNRPLREGEMFEAIIEKMVDRWSGSIECGEQTLFYHCMSELSPPFSHLQWLNIHCSYFLKLNAHLFFNNLNLGQGTSISNSGLLHSELQFLILSKS